MVAGEEAGELVRRTVARQNDEEGTKKQFICRAVCHL